MRARETREKKRNRSATKPRPQTQRTLAPAQGTPILRSADVRTIVHDLATRIAPADLSELLGREEELRRRCAGLTSARLALLRNQLELAIDCLRDHVDGACPQIPYYTISLLAGAVRYFSNELDVIPDFLPRVGRLDDAAVMAMACDMGAEGLRRYCAWKGRPVSTVLPVRAARARAAASL